MVHIEKRSGFSIDLNPADGLIHVSRGDEHVRSVETLEKARELIKRQQKKKFNRVKLFANKYYGNGFEIVTLTSITDSGEAWIVDSEGDRRKLYNAKNFYLITEENKLILAQMEEIDNRVMKLETQKEELATKLDRFDPKTHK